MTALWLALRTEDGVLTDPEDAGFRWVIRFGLFLVAALVGIGWLSLSPESATRGHRPRRLT